VPLNHVLRGTTHPGNALVDVGGGVGETLDLTGLSSEKTVEVRADLVGLAGTEGVALGTSGLWVSIAPPGLRDFDRSGLRYARNWYDGEEDRYEYG
jgi:hypothetical protein